MKSTPGTISALPSSRQSLTLVLIWSRNSDLISPVSPARCNRVSLNPLQNRKDRLTGKESEETLSARVDHINLVQRDGVDDLLADLELSLGALNELGLCGGRARSAGEREREARRTHVGSHGIVVSRASERPSELGDLARSLVNDDDISGDDLLLGQSVNHLVAEIVDGLHVGGLDGDLARLGGL